MAPIVAFTIAAARVTTALYKIVVTIIVGYYLAKEVIDYERQRRAAAETFGRATL